MQDRVIELLGRGYSQTVVASALGVDDSYVSQLVSLPHVRDAVSTLRLQHIHAQVELDSGADSLEKDALDKLHKLLPYVMKPMEVVRIYQIANAAKRRSSEVTSGIESKTPIVQLVLPQIMAMQFKLSTDKQVVEINGKSMAALPSGLLNKKLEERKQRITPLLSDSHTAAVMLNTLERGVPRQSIANVL